MTNPTDATLAHVLALPMVSALVRQVESSKLAPLFAAYRDEFLTCSAATSRHHNFTHGLVLHTAEVWEAAQRFHAARPLCEGLNRYQAATPEMAYTLDELFNAVVIHDLAKIRQYAPGDNHTWAKVPMICNQETWTLRELAKYGIALSDNELVGLLHAEGGYTDFDVDWRPMSVILHAADLWSSQAMATYWNPADALNLTCPRCQSGMLAKQGPSGPFFGCSKYPSCRGTRDASSVPSIDAAFLSWLQSNYPLPS